MDVDKKAQQTIWTSVYNFTTPATPQEAMHIYTKRFSKKGIHLLSATSFPEWANYSRICHLDKKKELQSNGAHYATIFAFTIKYSLCFGGFRYGQWTSILSFCKSKSSLDYKCIFSFGSSGYITTYQWTLQWTNLIFNGVIQANHCVKHQFILCTLKRKVKYMQNQYH